MKKSVEERFWSKVNKTDTCWIWTANAQRYGYFTLSSIERSELAHRVAWLLTYGPVPDGLNVLHKCDNTLCVNPDHLYLGTQHQNIKDCISRGRRNDDLTILTPEQAQEIRSSLLSQRKLAIEYNVSQTLIFRIRHNLRYGEHNGKSDAM